MLFSKAPVALAAFATLTTALPQAYEKHGSTQDILKSLAGTYSLVNTTR